MKTEKENQLEVIIPEEVKALAVKVPEQRKEEINAILHNVFSKVFTAGAEIEAIQVNSIADTKQMELAKEKRLEVKRIRLEATKMLDAQRQEVQNAMSGYQLEDKLLLKTKQVMEIQCKAIEEAAEYKEKYLERYAAEQKLKRDMERLEEARKYTDDVTIDVVEAMTDELFSFFLCSLKTEYEARKEAERKEQEEREKKVWQDNLHKKRLSSIKQYSQFFDIDSYFGEMSDEEFDKVQKDLEKKYNDYHKEQERIRKENEKLKAEQERRKEIASARLKELNGLFQFIPAHTDYIAMTDTEFKKLLAQATREKARFEADAKIKQQQLDEERKLAEQKAKEQEAENKRLQNELEARRRMEEEKAKAEAEEKAKVAQMSEKGQLEAWVNSFEITIPENLKHNETAKLILATHNKFKIWAINQIK